MLAAALGATAFLGAQHAFRVVGALGIARNLGAQHATGLRMRRIAMDLDGDTVLHAGDQRAGVGTVVRAGTGDFKATVRGRG